MVSKKLKKPAFVLEGDIIRTNSYMIDNEDGTKTGVCSYPVLEFTGWIAQETREEMVKCLNEKFIR